MKVKVRKLWPVVFTVVLLIMSVGLFVSALMLGWVIPAIAAGLLFVASAMFLWNEKGVKMTPQKAMVQVLLGGAIMGAGLATMLFFMIFQPMQEILNWVFAITGAASIFVGVIIAGKGEDHLMKYVGEPAWQCKDNQQLRQSIGQEEDV